jgi:hypothetical protein
MLTEGHRATTAPASRMDVTRRYFNGWFVDSAACRWR